MRIECCDDIERVKSHLANRPATPANATEAHLRELAEYFLHAASRIGEIRRGQMRPASSYPR
jgi:hypothetical protein